MPFEAIALLKKQQDLITMMKERHRLATLMPEARHTEELLVEKDKTLALLNEQYSIGLREWGSDLPELLVQKVYELSATNAPMAAIMSSIKDLIPADASEVLLQDYISQIIAEQKGEN